MKLIKDIIMFKKTLLAAGILAAASQAGALTVSLDPSYTGFSAVTTITDPTTAIAPIHTVQGLYGATTMTATNAGITLAGELAAGEKVKFTYTQPFATGATAPATLQYILKGEGSAVVDTIGFSRDGVSAVAGQSSITYSVTAVSYGSAGSTADTTVGGIIYSPIMTFAPLSAAGTVKINASVLRDGAVVDAGPTLPLLVGSAVNQMAIAATTAYNGIVDVNAARKKFTGAAVTDSAVLAYTETNKTDGLTATIPNAKVTADSTLQTGDATAQVGQEATETKSTVSFTGSFGFLDLDAATAGVQLALTGSTSNVLGDTDFVDTGSSITDGLLTMIDADAGETGIDVVLTSNNKAVIPVQTISSTWKIDYTSGSSDASSYSKTNALGGFTMNGASTSFYAVPYGPGVSQLLWVGNEGTQTGDLTATAFDSLGNSFPATGEYSLGSITAKTHKSIAATLLAQMKADGLDDTVSQRLQIAVTATVPAANVNFYGAYKVGDNRVALDTSAQKDRLKLSSTAVSTLQTTADSVLVDTGTTLDGIVDSILLDTGTTLDGIVDSILVDTGTTLVGTITTLDTEIGIIDGIVDNVLVDTSDNCFNTALIHAGLDGMATDGTTNGANATNFVHNSKISATTLIGSGSGTTAIKDCTP